MGLFFCAVVCLFKNEFECIVEWRICLSESVKCWCYTRYNETHHTALRQHSQRKKRWDGSLPYYRYRALHRQCLCTHAEGASQRQMVRVDLVYRGWHECGGFYFSVNDCPSVTCSDLHFDCLYVLKARVSVVNRN